jgi:PTS system mannose-specific IID component
MTASRVNIEIPLILNIKGVKLGIQEQVINALMPGLVPLGITMLVYWLVRKKVNINLIILIIFVLGISLSYLGVLGIPK